MATEDILIRYRTDVSQLEGDINKVIQSQQELTQATQQNTQAQQKAVTSAEFAAKKRAQLLEQEQQKLIKLRDAQKLAFDPTIIEKYNAQIAASQKRIELLGGSYQQAAQQAQNSNQQLLNGVNRIAGAFGVAFSAEALIQFGQQAVNSFLAAEETANSLKFAVLSIAGESEEALKRLDPIRTVLAVPILKGAQLFGVIVIYRLEVALFNDGQIALMQAFADQATITIENVRLFTEVEARTAQLTRSVGELKALGEVGQAVSSTLDLETVLSTIVSRATQLAGVDSASIYEYDEAREVFYMRATEGLPDELVEALRSAPLRKGEGAIGRLAVIGEPVEIRDILDEDVYQSRIRGTIIRLGFRSLLAVPLLREDRMLTRIPDFRVRFVGDLGNLSAFTSSIRNQTIATAQALEAQNARMLSRLSGTQINTRQNVGATLHTQGSAIVQNTEWIADAYGKSFTRATTFLRAYVKEWEVAREKITRGRYAGSERTFLRPVIAEEEVGRVTAPNIGNQAVYNARQASVSRVQKHLFDLRQQAADRAEKSYASYSTKILRAEDRAAAAVSRAEQASAARQGAQSAVKQVTKMVRDQDKAVDIANRAVDRQVRRITQINRAFDDAILGKGGIRLSYQLHLSLPRLIDFDIYQLVYHLFRLSGGII